MTRYMAYYRNSYGLGLPCHAGLIKTVERNRCLDRLAHDSNTNFQKLDTESRWQNGATGLGLGAL